MAERRCEGTKSDGEPCGAPPELVDPKSGFCPAHDPESGSQEMAARGAKGGSHSPYEETLDKLPDITCAADLREILNRTIRATAQGNCSTKRANSIARLSRSWIKVNSAVVGENKIEKIEQKMETLRERIRESRARESRPWEN